MEPTRGQGTGVLIKLFIVLLIDQRCWTTAHCVLNMEMSSCPFTSDAQSRSHRLLLSELTRVLTQIMTFACDVGGLQKVKGF